MCMGGPMYLYRVEACGQVIPAFFQLEILSALDSPNNVAFNCTNWAAWVPKSHTDKNEANRKNLKF